MSDKTLGAYERHEIRAVNVDGRPYCPAANAEFACSRETGHTGPHVAATRDVQNSICEVWNQDERYEKHNPAHDIDWQEIAEQHEDAIRALIQERDEALYQRDQWMRGNDSTRDILNEAIEERRRIARALDLPENATADAMVKHAAASRPLTPDAITDEMLTRAQAAYPGSDRPSLYRALIAALTEPPARPEGAEEIERLLTEDLGDFRPPVTPEAIADLLASRGVRVVGEERS